MKDMTVSMKLNHLSFPSADAAATAQFFEQYLGFSIDATWQQSYILKRPGFDVVIEHVGEAAPVWPMRFHAGFELPDADAVYALHERFVAAGIQMETGVFNNGRGSRFFCRAPGGVMFELNTRADAAAEYRGTFDN